MHTILFFFAANFTGMPADAMRCCEADVVCNPNRFVCRLARMFVPSPRCFLMSVQLLNRAFLCLTALALLFILPAMAQNDVLRTTLQKLGRDSSRVGFKPQSTWGLASFKDEFRLPFFDDLLASPLKIPLFSKDMIARYNAYIDFDTNAIGPYQRRQVRPLASLIQNSAKNLGIEMGKYGWDYSPTIDSIDPLRQEIRKIFDRAAISTGANVIYDLPTQPWSDVEKDFERQRNAMPRDVQVAVARIIAAIREAALLRDESLLRIPREDWQHIYRCTTLEESQCDAHTFDKKVYDAARVFDVQSAAFAAMKLAQTIEKNLPLLLGAKYTNDFSLDLPTPIGRIIVTSNGNETHYAPDCALLIDLRGNDAYLGATAASNPSLPVSVVIDAAGNDTYQNAHAGLPSQGAGVLGVGMLIDCAGDDSYASRTFSQGCGRFGVGLQYDAVGDDRYESVGFAQGAGMYGIGILFDRKGDDEYATVYYAQGYGFAKGLGLLADATGNDEYRADDTNLTHIGDETPLHNESDAQGYGAGRRADHTDGYSMSGGIGILNDLAGDDAYFAGVFGQGTGYWYGYGLLNDRSGNDSYRGVFFNLGSTAHFSIGVLFDDAGDDVTDLVMTCGVGMAHDCSASFYIDLAGNDRFIVSKGDNGSTSLGASLNNSFALFLNIGGDDVYKPTGNSIGYAVSNRRGVWSEFAPTTGIFLEIGGNDRYEYKQGKDNSEWRQPISGDLPEVNAIGVDVESGAVRFFR